MTDLARALQDSINATLQRQELAQTGVIVPPPKITKATQPALAETLWRCSSCGKWSHAKRKPHHHERASWEEPDDDAVVTRADEGRDEDGAPVTFWWVACGPFEEWEAWKVEQP